MKLFQCQVCGQALSFENTSCVRCGSRLGYLPDIGAMSAVEADGPNWTARAAPDNRYRFCVNWEQHSCNWMVAADSGDIYCRACQHNRTIPDISTPANLTNWQKIEIAKRRLFYSLIRLNLPTPTVASGDPELLVFDFLADSQEGPKVMTGHDNGVITIALSEADDALRESARASMGELYRTLLGHFRHEVGHYYWDKLVRDGGHLESFRALFGDERFDYGEALQRHYQSGPPNDWRDNHVSSYATMHPWEDWAETWAHYLHVVDTLETAGAFGVTIEPGAISDPSMHTEIRFDPYRSESGQKLIDAWLPLTFALNSVNRSMGLPDLYPFLLPPKVIEKLGYIHDLVHKQNRSLRAP